MTYYTTNIVKIEDLTGQPRSSFECLKRAGRTM